MPPKMPQILRIAVPTPLRRVFDYLAPQGVELTNKMRGVRVAVPFQSRILVGVLLEVVQESDCPVTKLKSAQAVLDPEPVIADDLFVLCKWAADYYHYSLGEVLALALPTLLRKGKDIKAPRKVASKTIITCEPPLELNADQSNAVKTINAANHFQPFLLDGITGSGKTEVYLQAIQNILQQDKQVLVLVPEISLTPQTIARFSERFPQNIVALHSGLSESKRAQGWQDARSGKAAIVIGTRSAIFTSFKKLGLIIVDEEHDQSFKQQDRFRYHARDLAIMRARYNQIPIVLGSATPSLESLLNVKRNRYQYLLLSQRAGGAILPQQQLIDMRTTSCAEGLSTTLLAAMQATLNAGNQVMLFLNRRGYAPVLYCTECGYIAECKRCDARLVYHRAPVGLRCHHCDAQHAIPKNCNKCRGTAMQPIGLGTQRLEQALQGHFPDVPIIRVDRDSTRKKGELQALLEQIHQQNSAILLGTQMLAKGHHFPRVTLVAVIDADSGLFSADFRAAEQMGQLLEQVAGRAGRADKIGTVMIQTEHPDHPLLQMLLQKGYREYAQTLLQERQAAALPPYSYMALLRAEAYKEEKVREFLLKLKHVFGASGSAINLFGPVSALMAKKKGLHCQHLLVRANNRMTLQKGLQQLLEQIDQLADRAVKWTLDVDPIEAM